MWEIKIHIDNKFRNTSSYKTRDQAKKPTQIEKKMRSLLNLL